MISVIVPIYNKEKDIKRCVNSILNQKFVEMQIILVDDGSTDQSKKICYELLADKRVELIEQENQGVSVARNAGILQAKGEWIAFVDPDDYLEEQCLYTLLNATNSETDIVACCCNAISSAGKKIDYFFDKSFSASSVSEKKRLFLQLMKVSYGASSNSEVVTAIGVPWGKLYRSSFIHENALQFDKRLRRMQDNNFNMHAFDKARRIDYINIPLYNYTMDNIQNYIEQKYIPWFEDNMKIFIGERYEFMKNSEYWNDKEVREFAYIEALDLMRQALEMGACHKNSDVLIKQRIRQIKKNIGESILIEAQKNLPIRRVKGVMRKSLYLSIKFKMALPLLLIYKIRHCYVSVKKIFYRSV